MGKLDDQKLNVSISPHDYHPFQDATRAAKKLKYKREIKNLITSENFFRSPNVGNVSPLTKTTKTKRLRWDPRHQLPTNVLNQQTKTVDEMVNHEMDKEMHHATKIMQDEYEKSKNFTAARHDDDQLVAPDLDPKVGEMDDETKRELRVFFKNDRFDCPN